MSDIRATPTDEAYIATSSGLHKKESSIRSLDTTLQQFGNLDEAINPFPNAHDSNSLRLCQTHKEQEGEDSLSGNPSSGSSELVGNAWYDRYEEEDRFRKAKEAEPWELKKKEPIQIHLQALHQAYRNIDPAYTVFAFGGTIPPDEIDAGKLIIEVKRWGSLDEVDCRFDGQKAGK